MSHFAGSGAESSARLNSSLQVRTQLDFEAGEVAEGCACEVAGTWAARKTNAAKRLTPTRDLRNVFTALVVLFPRRHSLAESRLLNPLHQLSCSSGRRNPPAS